MGYIPLGHFSVSGSPRPLFGICVFLRVDVSVITSSETRLEGLSSGQKDLEKDEEKTREREPSKNKEEMKREQNVERG